MKFNVFKDDYKYLIDSDARILIKDYYSQYVY